MLAWPPQPRFHTQTRTMSQARPVPVPAINRHLAEGLKTFVSEGLSKKIAFDEQTASRVLHGSCTHQDVYSIFKHLVDTDARATRICTTGLSKGRIVLADGPLDDSLVPNTTANPYRLMLEWQKKTQPEEYALRVWPPSDLEAFYRDFLPANEDRLEAEDALMEVEDEEARLAVTAAAKAAADALDKKTFDAYVHGNDERVKVGRHAVWRTPPPCRSHRGSRSVSRPRAAKVQDHDPCPAPCHRRSRRA